MEKDKRINTIIQNIVARAFDAHGNLDGDAAYAFIAEGIKPIVDEAVANALQSHATDKPEVATPVVAKRPVGRPVGS